MCITQLFRRYYTTRVQKANKNDLNKNINEKITLLKEVIHLLIVCIFLKETIDQSSYDK